MFFISIKQSVAEELAGFQDVQLSGAISWERCITSLTAGEEDKKSLFVQVGITVGLVWRQINF
jgi:hypothetical protein